MTQAVKRTVAGFLCILLFLGCVPMQEINAADIGAQKETDIQQAADKEQETEIPDEEKQPEQRQDGEKAPAQETAEAEQETAAKEQDGKSDSDILAVDENTPEDNQTAAAEKGKLNYIYVESPYLETPAEENVVVSWGDGSENISSMTLVCEKADGSQSEWVNTKQTENLFLFNKAFVEKESGTYQFTLLKYVQDDVEYALDLSELQIEAKFGVNEEYEGYESYPEDASDIPLDEVEASVVVLDEENIENAEEEIETTLEDAAEVVGEAAAARSAAPKSRAAARAAKTWIVALDPGHGAHDGGASNATYHAYEKDLCLKIAQYAKAELEEYNNVKVVMTRDSDATCPTIYERAKFASDAGADILVSIHLNAANGNAYGAEIWVPNNNGNATIGAHGQELGEKILPELLKLGLTGRGVKTRDESSGKDYYGISRYAKEFGMAGIIIEHAFIDNNSDYEKYLNTDAKLKKLGIADATGIANYLGLSKGSGIWVKDLDEFAGTAVIQAAGLGSNGKVTIKNTTTGVSKTHTLSEGKGTISINTKDYNGGGNYTATGGNYNVSFYMSTDPSCKVSYTEVSKEKQYKLSAVFPDMPKAVQKVQFAVWSGGQQEDLQWYNGDQSKSGKRVTWTTTADIAKHKRAGDYNVHVYALLEDGSQRFLGATGFKVSAPTLKVAVTGKNQDAGTFDLKASDVKSASGVSKIRAAVWCAENQSDIKWYDMSKKSDGSYTAKVSMANHKYAAGTYKVHVYITAGNGIEAFGGGLTQSMSLPNIKISASDKDGKETTYNLKASNTGFLGVLKGVRFGVWSEAGGQDDLKWYDGTRNSSGDWTAAADIRKHKTAGKYYVHAYATQANGNIVFIGATTYKVSNPTLKAVVTGKNQNAGTFDIKVSDVKSVSGISKVRAAVWCTENQSDMKWYDMGRQSDGSYTAKVSMANHKYAVGTYKIHIYVTTGNGMEAFGGGLSQSVTMPDVKVSASDKDGKETTYNLKASNVSFLGALKGVRFGVWSDVGGQDDIQWYNGTRNSSGDWTATADIRKHKTAGKYYVHAYATLANGNLVFIGAATFKVSNPTLNVTVTGKNQNAGTFDLKVSDVKSASGVSKVRAAVWCAANQSDMKWYDMGRQSDGSYTAKVSMANHKYAAGTYKVHVYVTAGNGVEAFGGGLSQSVTMPNAKVSASDKDGKETTYNLKASNISFLGVLKSVRFGVWSEAGGQDDLKWYNGSRNSSGDWTASADIRNHKTAGKYHVHAYATLANGDMVFIGATDFSISTPTGTSVRVTGYDNEYGSFQVVISGIKSASGVSKVQVPVWSQADQSDIKWYDAKKQSDGSYAVNVDPMYHNYNSGNYNIHIYAISGNGVSSCVGIMTQTVKATQRYTIMGDTTATVDQMVRYYERHSSIAYPSRELGAGGAPDLRTFCQMYYDEAAMEGVRAEVAFAQAMKETGWLKYGGIVNIGQFNFAGIGALDGNANGNCASFPDVRTGIRAQIQHLKAYGSTAALNNPKVDPRFDKVTRGAARYVEWLGQKENPTGAGWATGENYGLDIVAMIKVLKSM